MRNLSRLEAADSWKLRSADLSFGQKRPFLQRLPRLTMRSSMTDTDLEPSERDSRPWNTC